MKKFITNGIDLIANSFQYALALGDFNEIATSVSLILAIICSLIIVGLLRKYKIGLCILLMCWSNTSKCILPSMSTMRSRTVDEVE